MLRGMAIGTLGLVALAGSAWAADQDEAAFIVTRADTVVHESATQLRVVPEPTYVQIGYPQRSALGVLYAPVLVPGATVSEAVSRTPALPHLVKMQVGQTTILIDPYEDYLSERPGQIDHGHSIVRAQRTFLALQARNARVVRNPLASEAESVAEEPVASPRAILLRPNLLDKPRKDGLDGMPMIPRPQPEAKPAGRPVAMAD